MVRLETITSPHSPGYLSISRQLDCFKELPLFTLPELSVVNERSEPSSTPFCVVLMAVNSIVTESSGPPASYRMPVSSMLNAPVYVI